MTQLALIKVWRSSVDGCPHYHGEPEGVAKCDANEMRSCIYETESEATTDLRSEFSTPERATKNFLTSVVPRCEVFAEIVEEWRIEAEICPECCEVRPGDERVKANMKCGWCSDRRDVQ